MSESKGNIVGQRDDAPTNDVENKGVGSTRITPKRALHVNLRDEDGNEVAVGGGVSPATTGATTNVSQSASNVTLLAANTARKGVMVFNDSLVYLYLKLGATASTSSYTVKIDTGGYWEMSPLYTGIISGIWSGAGTGNARITELT